MRIDLAEALDATRPSLWRFPGGNNLEVCLVTFRTPLLVFNNNRV